ncbi:hypothetical protein CDD83_6656 [Cordyceps sp. RAO-2017]|nr:hypothetical protein CDD83_6656 [Cordyceps sp. RAO-2017]
MAKQHALFSRRLPPITARRLAALLLCLSLLALAFIALLTSAVPLSPSLAAHDRRIAVPRASLSNLSPLRQTANTPPPRQGDDHGRDDHEYAGSSWSVDSRWLSVPFSSSLTQDSRRVVLPPLRQRQPIYCYYDTTVSESRDETEAEKELLLTWRRAWWASGFRPVVLNEAVAKRNPRYAELRRLDSDDHVRKDLTRWLAWETMGGGLMAHYTLLPTLPDDPTLSSFRRGQLPNLMRWQALGDAFFAGRNESISAAIRQAMEPAGLSLLETSMSDLPGDLFELGNAPASLASYTPAILRKKYGKVAESFEQSRAHGLRSLNRLINTHLHISWQNQFPNGIEVLKPRPEHTTEMISSALKLAQQLASCSDSPMPSTCPPNQPDCRPCVATAPMRVTTPSRYLNSSLIFSIGTVPHPWTLALLDNMRESFNVSWIRRESSRDPWLTVVTQALLGTGVSGARRIMSLKEAVAREHVESNSLWLAAEKDDPRDLDWFFGFAVPERGMDPGRSESPVPADRLRESKAEPDTLHNGPVASEKDLAKEAPLLERAQHVLTRTGTTEEIKLRASLEAWNMADTEVWRNRRRPTSAEPLA